MAGSEEDTYYNNVNGDLLAFMPGGQQRVVEIGCGAGALAAAYREANPACHYTGVEMMPEMAARARAVMNRVIEADVETLPAEALGDPGSVDIIVYGDVLEHLRDPWAVLRAHLLLLRPGGVVAVSLPNVQYWGVLEDLLRGTWTYRDSGVLDRTHLRFFTLDTAISLLTDAGLTVVGIRGRVKTEDQSDDIRALLAPVCAALGASEQPDRMRCIQYVFQAVNSV